MDSIEVVETYKGLLCFHLTYMTLAWILCIMLKNGSMVDFGWPSGFFIMCIQFFLTGKGKKLFYKILCSFYSKKAFNMCALLFSWLEIYGWMDFWKKTL